MPDRYLTVYPGCHVRVTDETAAERNPLLMNPLVWIKDDLSHLAKEDADGWCHAPVFRDAHRWTADPADRPESRLADACVMCSVFGFGDLCDRHRTILQGVTP